MVKIHWTMLILEWSQGCYAVKIWLGDIDLWPGKSIGFQIRIRTKYMYVPSLVKIHCRILILVFTRMLCEKKLTQWPWSLTLKTNRVPDSRKDEVCTKFVQNPLRYLKLSFIMDGTQLKLNCRGKLLLTHPLLFLYLWDRKTSYQYQKGFEFFYLSYWISKLPNYCNCFFYFQVG